MYFQTNVTLHISFADALPSFPFSVHDKHVCSVSSTFTSCRRFNASPKLIWQVYESIIYALQQTLHATLPCSALLFRPIGSYGLLRIDLGFQVLQCFMIFIL